MKIQQTLKYAMTAVLLSMLANQAHANNCGDISPLMQSLGEDYIVNNYSPEYEAKDSNFSENDLVELIETSKLRSGKGVRYRCFGTGDNERLVTTEFNLEDIVKIETARGNVQIVALEDSQEKKASAVLDLPKASMWHATSTDTYSTSQVIRRANYNSSNLTFPLAAMYPSNTVAPARSGSQHAEITRTIQTSMAGITLTETLYFNGRKTDWVTWEIDR